MTRILPGAAGGAFGACVTPTVLPATRMLPLRLADVPFAPIL
jgi:hypothetical protein